jgi:hypothetical protein
MESPQTQGEEGDHGASTRQRTPFVGPTLMGGRALAPMPSALSPRNWGQAVAEAADAFVVAAVNSAQATAYRKKGFISFLKIRIPHPGHLPWEGRRSLDLTCEYE